MKRLASYRVYATVLILMVVGVLLQGLLLSGHIPFLHFALRSPVTAVQATTQRIMALRDLKTATETRFHRPTFQTGIIFPQWGASAYNTNDTNWQTGLHEIESQTASQWIELPINLYQTSVYSTHVITSDLTATPAGVAAGIRAAHAMHYRVFVVPLVSAGGTLTWSGSIQFATQQQTQAWFDSYWQALEPYAAVAAQAGAEEMAIGTEFALLEAAPAFYWNQLIERMQQVFHGKLTYDINWSSLYQYDPLPSWLKNPALSAIGVSVYVELTDTPQRLDPRAASSLWKAIIGKLLDDTAMQLGKPILISEIGYRDSAYTFYHPWERDAIAQAQPPDAEEQAAAYNAALSNVVIDPHITGIFFWAWSVPLFEPNWRPAAKVLYKWYTSPLA